MKTTTGITITLALASMIACTTHKEKQERKQLPGTLHKLEWLLGRWENNSEEGLLSETWKAENDSVYVAETYFQVKTDTLFSEKVKLEEHMDGIYYCATIPDQNKGKQVRFKMTNYTKTSVVFENPKHDFPQKIRYTIANDSITAEISGIQNGTTKKELFVMRRSD